MWGGGVSGVNIWAHICLLWGKGCVQWGGRDDGCVWAINGQGGVIVIDDNEQKMKASCSLFGTLKMEMSAVILFSPTMRKDPDTHGLGALLGFSKKKTLVFFTASRWNSHHRNTWQSHRAILLQTGWWQKTRDQQWWIRDGRWKQEDFLIILQDEPVTELGLGFSQTNNKRLLWQVTVVVTTAVF